MRTLLVTACLMGATLAMIAPALAQADEKEVVLVEPVDTNKDEPDRRRPIGGGGGILTGFLFPGFGFPRHRPGFTVVADDVHKNDDNIDDYYDDFPNFHTVQTGLRSGFLSSLLNSIFGTPAHSPGYPDRDNSNPDTADYFFDFAPGTLGSAAGKGDKDSNSTTAGSGCGLICLLGRPFSFPTLNFGGIGQLPDGAEPDVVFEEKVLPDGTVVRTNKTSYSSDDGSFHVVYHTTSLKKQGSTDGEDNELDDSGISGPEVFAVATEVEGAVSGSSPTEKEPEVLHRETSTATSTSTTTTTTAGPRVGVDSGLSV